MTKITSLALIPGSTFSFGEIYSALTWGQDITNLTYGENGKTISVDLDLYKKVYLLVHGSEDLRNRYIIVTAMEHINEELEFINLGLSWDGLVRAPYTRFSVAHN